MDGAALEILGEILVSGFVGQVACFTSKLPLDGFQHGRTFLLVIVVIIIVIVTGVGNRLLSVCFSLFDSSLSYRQLKIFAGFPI